MKLSALIIFMACVASTGAEPAKSKLDVAFVRQFVSGEYALLGRKPGSAEPYTGRVTFRENNQTLEFTRTIQGKTQHGLVILDTKTSEDGKPVLRMSFPSMVSSTTRFIFGAVTSTITRGLPVTFIPGSAAKRKYPGWKRSFRSGP